MPGTQNKRWETKGMRGGILEKQCSRSEPSWKRHTATPETEKVDGQEVKQRAADLDASQMFSFKTQRENIRQMEMFTMRDEEKAHTSSLIVPHCLSCFRFHLRHGKARQRKQLLRKLGKRCFHKPTCSLLV